MSDIGDWFRSVPFITRYWFAASVAVPLIGKLGLIDITNLILIPEFVISRFHVRFCGSVRVRVFRGAVVF